MITSSGFYLSCILFGVAIVYAADDHDADSLGWLLLRAPEIRSITDIKTLTAADSSGSKQKFGHRVHEYYSNQQQRARLELHPNGIDERHVIYYYDHLNDKRLLRFAEAANEHVKCEPSDIDSLANGLFGALSRTYEHFSGESWQNLGAPDLSGHIIGPLRILFFINQRRHLLSNPIKETGLIQGQGSIAYEYITADIADPKITVYYADSGEHHTAGKDLPFRILMKTGSGSELTMDFLQNHKIHRDHFQHQKELDLFAFPIGHGCSSELSGPVASSHWRVNPPEVKVVSLQAKVNEFIPREQASPQDPPMIEYERFVAFDMLANAMRVDTFKANKYSIDIYDFHRSYIYNILHETERKPTSGQMSDKSQPTDQKCMATTLLHHAKFIYFSALIQMGRARVRGLECVVFEHVTKELPAILFTHLNYRDKGGIFFERAFEQAAKTDQNGGHIEPYSVIYYFVAQNFDPQPRVSYRDLALGPLVHVDIYQSGRLHYAFDISNFVYQLADAPNGDQQVELFALRDRCADKGGEQNSAAAYYAELKFELLYDHLGPLSRSAQEAAQLLAGSMTRNKAIIRAVSSASFEVPATKIYDVESGLELRDDDKQLVVHGTCKLIHSEVESVTPRVIGATDSWWSQAFHATYEDCFWQAARERQHSPQGLVLFVACNSYCSIDDSPQVISHDDTDISEREFESSKFSISDELSPGSCAIMLMEADSRRLDSPYKIWDQAYSILRGHRVDLGLPDEDETDQEKKLKFTIDQLEISNDRWSSSLGYQVATVDGKHSSLRNGELLNGMGLVAASGHLEKAPRWSASAGMSYSVCHSLCMANMSCRSFSVCVTSRHIECITSQVNIGDPLMLTQIEEKKKGPQAENQGVHLIKVAYPTDAKSATTTGNESEQTVELRVDIRCKLYKRDALEMFRMVAPIDMELKDANIRSVSGPGECAELCLGGNLAFFERMSGIAQELLNGTGHDSMQERMVNEYKSNLSLWCSSFRYLNLLDHSLPTKEIAERLDPDKLKSAGLCSLMRPSRAKPDGETRKEPNQGATGVEFKQYRFIYTSLYEAQYGRKIVPVDRESVRLWSSEVETCARACFLQSTSLKPWCKSFDFIEKSIEPGAGANKQWISSYCVLNSLSLSDLGDKVDKYLHETDSTDTTTWHYEPRDTFSIDGLVEARALVFADVDSTATNSYGNRPKNHSSLWMFLVVLAALLCSGWLVAMKGAAIIDNLFKRQPLGGSSPPLVKRIRFQLPDHIDLNEIHE